jgi:hypothetical protein
VQGGSGGEAGDQDADHRVPAGSGGGGVGGGEYGGHGEEVEGIPSGGTETEAKDRWVVESWRPRRRSRERRERAGRRDMGGGGAEGVAAAEDWISGGGARGLGSAAARVEEEKRTRPALCPEWGFFSRACVVRARPSSLEQASFQTAWPGWTRRAHTGDTGNGLRA